ncbi:MAG: monovalent cation/H+ antiporter complex subunit F [Halopseudomonas yangmingensis]|uniref:Multicomponent Na+:H+ antiporter subunit F n=1 Tax=Halopseudomonas yangmingensis TaxID=1720063 RepID=A0A1I4PT92_9GAMM|nr:monovalent cation/H+ antiporter complex subunit F [Halopseudomonas yangmingensis]SFM30575.1 multicomponent Na+:H+ antiporter subunit F [Halopseudomonas yangmingensis]
MTVELAGADWVLALAGGMLVVSVLLVMLRLLIGPERPDRAVAVDAMTLIGVAGVSILALVRQQAVLLDVALVLAIVSFLGSVAFSLLFTGTHHSDQAHGQGRSEQAEVTDD